MTTIYGLYFSHHYTYTLQITFIHDMDLCGQLSTFKFAVFYAFCYTTYKNTLLFRIDPGPSKFDSMRKDMSNGDGHFLYLSFCLRRKSSKKIRMEFKKKEKRKIFLHYNFFHNRESCLKSFNCKFLFQNFLLLSLFLFLSLSSLSLSLSFFISLSFFSPPLIFLMLSL